MFFSRIKPHLSMNNDNFAESFDFNSHLWPPSGNITSTRFMSHDKYLAEGSFRICYLGHDTITQRRVVAKKFKEHNAMEDKYWTEDIGAARKAQEFATKFNAVMQTNKPIRFIQPIIDECAVNIHPPFVSGEKVLIEPYLGNDAYIKFNSNSGWENARMRSTRNKTR